MGQHHILGHKHLETIYLKVPKGYIYIYIYVYTYTYMLWLAGANHWKLITKIVNVPQCCCWTQETTTPVSLRLRLFPSSLGQRVNPLLYDCLLLQLSLFQVGAASPTCHWKHRADPVCFATTMAKHKALESPAHPLPSSLSRDMPSGEGGWSSLFPDRIWHWW